MSPRSDKSTRASSAHDFRPRTSATSPFARSIRGAGTAQLAALTLYEGGAGMAAVLTTVVVINARLTMYGAALEPLFRAQPTWFR